MNYQNVKYTNKTIKCKQKVNFKTNTLNNKLAW